MTHMLVGSTHIYTYNIEFWAHEAFAELGIRFMILLIFTGTLLDHTEDLQPSSVHVQYVAILEVLGRHWYRPAHCSLYINNLNTISNTKQQKEIPMKEGKQA